MTNSDLGSVLRKLEEHIRGRLYCDVYYEGVEKRETDVYIKKHRVIIIHFIHDRHLLYA